MEMSRPKLYFSLRTSKNYLSRSIRKLKVRKKIYRNKAKNKKKRRISLMILDRNWIRSKRRRSKNRDRVSCPGKLASYLKSKIQSR